MKMHPYYRITTSFPVTSSADYLTRGGHTDQGRIMLESDKALNCSPELKLAQKLLLDSDPIGRMGNYIGVYELSVGVEAYTPDTGSNPGEGEIGIEELMRVINFTTYANPSTTTIEQVYKFINEIRTLHPWEHPVIKLYAGNELLITEAKD